MTARYDVEYDGSRAEDPPYGVPSWRTTVTDKEQVLVFADERTARTAMGMIIEAAEKCREEGAVVRRPAIGDEAVSSVHVQALGVRRQGVAFRKGRVVAVYGDERGPEAPEVADLADHRGDAREMAWRLASFGY